MSNSPSSSFKPVFPLSSLMGTVSHLALFGNHHVSAVHDTHGDGVSSRRDNKKRKGEKFAPQESSIKVQDE
jgi:hypothetical protein